MRVLKREELEMVSGARNATSEHANGLQEEPKHATSTGKDKGNHYGWCRGLGNTGRSMGTGSGAQMNNGINKHGVDVWEEGCGRKLQ